VTFRYAGVDTRAYGDEDTLFFIRIKGAEQFFSAIYGPQVMETLFGHLKRRATLSEYPNGDYHIDLSQYTVSDYTPDDWQVYRTCVHQELPAIIARCRGLRDVPFAEAKDLVLRATKWAHDFFRSHEYRLFVFHIIDNYVVDILCRVAQYRGIVTLCLSEWFIEPYRRHTIFGELHPARDVDDTEVDAVMTYFETPRKAYWLDGIDRRNRQRYFLYLYVRFLILYFWRYTVGYCWRGNLGYEYRFPVIFRVRLRNLFVHRYFSTITADEVAAEPERFIVIPLHTFPEANVDYWMTDWRDADYYTSLYEAITFLRSEGMTVLLKEHPGFMYQRDAAIYRQLRAFGNVRLIDPYSPSSSVLDTVPQVLVWHGTMGIEAVMRGRRVSVFDSTYYSGDLLPPYRRFRDARVLNPDQRRRFIASLLRGVEPVMGRPAAGPPSGAK
jgi:hypothetical protein